MSTFDIDAWQIELEVLAEDLGCRLDQPAPNTPGMMYVEFGYVEGPTLDGESYTYRNPQMRYLVNLHELGHFYYGHTQGRPIEKYLDKIAPGYEPESTISGSNYLTWSKQFYFDNGVLQSEAQAWDFALDSSVIPFEELLPDTKQFMWERCMGSYYRHAEMVGFNTPGQTLGNGDRDYVSFSYGEPTEFFWKVKKRMLGET